MKISDINNYLEEIAPLHLQEDYDNAGLIVGNEDTKITEVLISLDVTEAVIDEAIHRGCNLIVAHHPIVFRGLKRFNGNNYVEKVIIKAIRNNIAIYASHTNLDSVLQNGVNTKIAEIIGLEDLQILDPKKGLQWNNEEVGIGMTGYLKTTMDELSFLEHLKKKMNLKTFKYTELLGKPIKKVAICGGSGSFLLQGAIAANADIFISSDYKYHEFFDANGKLIIADIGHYESEIFTVDLLYQLLTKKFRNFAFHCTKVNTNPVKYY